MSWKGIPFLLCLALPVQAEEVLCAVVASSHCSSAPSYWDVQGEDGVVTRGGSYYPCTVTLRIIRPQEFSGKRVQVQRRGLERFDRPQSAVRSDLYDPYLDSIGTRIEISLPREQLLKLSKISTLEIDGAGVLLLKKDCDITNDGSGQKTAK